MSDALADKLLDSVEHKRATREIASEYCNLAVIWFLDRRLRGHDRADACQEAGISAQIGRAIECDPFVIELLRKHGIPPFKK